MKRKSRTPSQWVVGSAILAASAGLALGQDKKQVRFTFDLGYRFKYNESGNQDLYRSQVNLGEGPKLLASDVFVAFPEGSNRWIDTLEMRLGSWGGDPYNNAQVIAQKQGVFRLKFDYLNAQYFNSIPQFANPFFEDGNLLSQHRYDTSRRVFGLDLALRPGKSVSPFVAYNRASRQGAAQTTLRAGNDEFLLNEDASSSSDTLRGGVDLNLSRFSLRLEQGVRWYRNKTTFGASGFQEGNSIRPILGQDITLDSYNGRNDFEGTIPFSTGLATWHPSDSLLLRAKVAYSLADLDTTTNDTISGNFFSFEELAIFFSDLDRRSFGQAKKPNLNADFSADWQLHRNLRIQERFSLRRSHVSGLGRLQSIFFDVDPVLGPAPIDRLETDDAIDTFLAVEVDKQEVQGIFRVDRLLSFRAGHRFVRRRLKLRDEEFSWDGNALILGATLRFSARNRIAADFEFNRADQPIFRSEPVDYQRLRLRGRITPMDSLQIDGSLSLFDNDNEDIDLNTTDRDYALQLRYTPSDRLSLSVEYERSKLNNSIPVIIPQTRQVDLSLFRERGDYASAYLSLQPLGKLRLDLGYSFWDVVGNLPLSFHRPLARLEVPLTRSVVAYGQWNGYDYQERTDLFPQQYQAQLLLVGLRVSVSKE